MKKIIVLILSVLMVASLCVPIAGCNKTEKPKSAEELFFSASDSGIMERLASSMGMDVEAQKNMMKNTDKNEKVAFSLGVSDLTVGGMPITQSPIRLSFDGAIDKNGNTAGMFNWSYMTDNLDVYLALGKDCAAVKLADLTDYLDIAPLFEGMNTDDGQSAELVAALEKAMTDWVKILGNSFDRTKITEKSEEITVNDVKINVRAISYTLAGDELAAVIEKIVSEADKNAAISELLAKFGMTDALKNIDLNISENDKLSVVRYFEVNEARGCDAELYVEDANLSIKINSRTNSTKDTDYADIELTAAEVDASSVPVGGINLKGLYKRESTGSFLCEFTIGSGDSASLSVNLGSLRLSGTTTDTAEGKRTDITMTVGISGAVLQIPCAITVKKSDKDNIDIAFEMSINIPSMLSVKLTAEEKISLTDEAVTLPSKDDIKDADSVPEGTKEKLEEKLKNTAELFEIFDLIFGDDTDYPDYDDLDI